MEVKNNSTFKGIQEMRVGQKKLTRAKVYLILSLVILGIIIYSIFFYYRNLLYGPPILFEGIETTRGFTE